MVTSLCGSSRTVYEPCGIEALGVKINSRKMESRRNAAVY